MSEVGQLLIKAVKDAAADNPTFVYETPFGGCCYVREGQPSCLVGKAAWNIGLIDAAFEEETSNEGGVADLAEALGFNLDGDEEEWLNRVQEAQDGGTSWGQAAKLTGLR